MAAIVEATSPMEAMAALCRLGRDAGLEAWLLAAGADQCHGFLYSLWPVEVPAVQAQMDAMAGRLREHKTDAPCASAAPGSYPVEATSDETEPVFPAFADWRMHEVTVGGEPAAVILAATLTPDARPDWEQARRLVEAAEPGLAYLIAAARQPEGTLDPQTGLYTAAYFEEQLRREGARAASCGGELALVVVDIAPRNGWPGIEAADLRAIAHLMAGSSRRSDTWARLGPSRLGAILPQTSKREALMAASRLEELISEDRELARYLLRYGVSGWDLGAPDCAGLLREAEEAANRAAAMGIEGPFLY
jgi:diguanylate cyclase (GGDEF)-like protein